MSVTNDLSENVSRLAMTNANLAINARVNCGTRLDKFREDILDHSLRNRQALIDWFEQRHIVVAVGDSVWRAGGLPGKPKG